MPETHWYFKLFNSIKEKHEVDFAELELTGLFGQVERVRNFSDILNNTPFDQFRDSPTRIQDMLSHELPHGECHGFCAKTDQTLEISHLAARLAYTREIFLTSIAQDSEALLHQAFPGGVKGKNEQHFQSGTHALLRVITNQYFLEKSQYVSKLSRNEQEAARNVETLLTYLTTQLYRIPATETMQIGKRLEDYFAVREEPSLYLTHYMHPYKGKFHPKMVRALLNFVCTKQSGTVMDNFAGCGTLLVEATLMELDSMGIEINPLSALMCNVKCGSLSIDPYQLKKTVDAYLQELRTGLLSYEQLNQGSTLLFPPKYSKGAIEIGKQKVLPQVRTLFNDPKAIDQILVAHQLLATVEDREIHDFLLLTLSGTISDLARRRRGEFLQVLEERLKNLYLRIYIFHELNKTLKIALGESRTHTADTRNMHVVQSETIDAIINSPPYSTALDYIKNDLAQLTLLKLAEIAELETNMIGNPHHKIYTHVLFDEIDNNHPEYVQLPSHAKDSISALIKHGRTKEALRTYKFFKDMTLALKEMYRVLKKKGKAAIVIGNNHYKLNDAYSEVKNDQILREIGMTLGFEHDRTIMRELEKTQAGMIRYESVLILEKP